MWADYLDKLRKVNTNWRQLTEIHLTSQEFKISKNENNFITKFIDRLDNDSSFIAKIIVIIIIIIN